MSSAGRKPFEFNRAVEFSKQQIKLGKVISLDKIADKCNVSKKTARKAVRHLEDKKVVAPFLNASSGRFRAGHPGIRWAKPSAAKAPPKKTPHKAVKSETVADFLAKAKKNNWVVSKNSFAYHLNCSVPTAYRLIAIEVGFGVLRPSKTRGEYIFVKNK